MNIDELMELARLKGRVIALEAELESEKAAYKALRASSFVTSVPSEDYEKLKAKVERLRKAGDAMANWFCALASENARLKHEVEAYRSASDEVAAAFLALPAPHNQVARVCEGIESLKAEVERLTEVAQVNKAAAEAVRFSYENAKMEVERLRSQFANSERKVERLVKTGIAMSMKLPDTDEANAAYSAFERAVRS